eukprot:scaffold45802_cov25-Tisochrysis_lutea.AAC.2
MSSEAPPSAEPAGRGAPCGVMRALASRQRHSPRTAASRPRRWSMPCNALVRTGTLAGRRRVRRAPLA